MRKARTGAQAVFERSGVEISLAILWPRICWRRRSIGTFLPSFLKAPVGPAVAAWRAFQSGTNLMDRPFDIIADQRAIGAHLGFVTLVHGIQVFARAQHAAFDQLAKGHARFGAFGRRGLQRFAVKLAHLAMRFVATLR